LSNALRKRVANNSICTRMYFRYAGDSTAKMGTPDAYFHANLGTPMPIFTRIWAFRCLYLRIRHENRHHILMPISTKNMGTPLWKWYEFACKTIHYKFQVVQQTIWLLQLTFLAHPLLPVIELLYKLAYNSGIPLLKIFLHLAHSYYYYH